MKKLVSLVAVLMLLAAPAFAMDLAGAKADGLVGETPTGLVAMVKDAPGVADLVKTTNAGRLDIYKDTAAKQGITLEQMQAIAGKKLIDQTPAGQYIQTPAGKWTKK